MKKLLYNNKLGIAITCFGIFLLWVNGRIFFVWGDHSTPRIAAMFFAIIVFERTLTYLGVRCILCLRDALNIEVFSL